jgi:2-aminoadipate transaminase
MLPLPQLDPRSTEPLYRQLYADIRAKIQSGQLASGERVPPTRELAGLLGLNRTTVAAAYELLEKEGLIQGHVGRGSFVAPQPESGPALDWQNRFASLPQQEAPPASMPVESVGISFTSARPAADLFPLDAFRAACEEVIRDSAAARILQLGSPFGYAPLRRYLLDRAVESGVARASDDLLIANGCQQALDLLQRVFTQPGDTVLMEDPIYPGLRNVFAQAGVRTVGIPVGPEGIEVTSVARLTSRTQAKLLVVTPNFQNPTGATMPLSARLQLLKVAREAGLIVVENDIYGELRYLGSDLPTVKQLDDTGDTLQIKSFSKLAFPGLRVGWITGPRAVIARLAERKQWTDLHTDQLSQAVLLRFAESGRLEAHRRRMLAAGAERLRAVLAACEAHLPAGSRFTRPEGGMNLWVRLPEPLDSSELLPRARAAGVSYLPGRYFAVSRSEGGSLRLSFAGLAPEAIESGVAILARICGEELERTGAARAAGLAPAIV